MTELTIEKRKMKVIEWVKIFSVYISDKVLYPEYIKYSYKLIYKNNKQSN